MNKVCIKCGQSYPVSEFAPQNYGDGYANQCRICRNEIQRARRKKNGNSITIKYEKTKRGFLMRLYHNMHSRIVGIQKAKHHLYAGKCLLSKDEFYQWGINHPVFNSLWDDWVSADYAMKLAPSVDRVDSRDGYHLSNMEWVTHSENSRRSSITRKMGNYVESRD